MVVDDTDRRSDYDDDLVGVVMKPICVKCQRFYRCKKTGYYFVEGMPKPGETRVLPGIQEPDRWEPYKLWAGDLWECQGCGHQLVSGTGQSPIAEHYQPQFTKLAAFSELQVNDC